MNEITYWSALLIGLAGGLHCFGMCGGIASALRLAAPAGTSHWPYTLSYNAGRLFSYTLAGALTGGFGQIIKQFVPLAGPILAFISGALLLAMAAYIGNWWHGLSYLERAGNRIWQYIQPLSQRFIPFNRPLSAVPYGIIWGWLPCGLVYSVLSWSLASTSAADGALLMLCFGLGTLPALLATAVGAHWLVTAIKHPVVRQTTAVLLTVFAVLLLARAARYYSGG